MHEVSCANCTATFEYNHEDYIHLCPYCSSGFVLDLEEGAKDLVGDHYLVPNQVEKDRAEEIFRKWIEPRYHRPERIDSEFKVLGSYGVMLPFWVVSCEAHTFWSGHSAKQNQYPGQANEHGANFVREEGRFSRRYRWALLARKSPKEHWGLERLHHPREPIMVDWDGFPLDESMGVPQEGMSPVYEARTPFKFENSSGMSVAGVQTKESRAIARARDQILEYHRRLSKLKVGTLFDHRTEIEVVGIHLVHVPFWILRYAFVPKGPFRFFTTARERRIVIQGYTHQVLEAETALNAAEKVMTNFIVCSVLALLSLALSVFVTPYLFFVFLIFLAVCLLSAWRIFKKDKQDPDLMKGFENKEPVL